MATLKRKRSDSELSCSSAATSAFSSPPRPANSVFVFGQSSPAPVPLPGPVRPAAPSQSGRTMKRFRDNRPSEEQVHQRTLGLLYSAQQNQQPPMTSTLVQEVQEQEAEQGQEQTPRIDPQPQQNQRSLHSFWNLPGPAPPMTRIATPQIAYVSAAADGSSPSSGEDYEMT